MNGEEEEIQKAIGTLCFIQDGPITGQRNKLKAVMEDGELDLDRAVWMALAFCFDLVRRCEYSYLALRPFGKYADREIVSRMSEENQRLADLGQDYRALAKALEKMIITLAKETVDDHNALRDEILSD
ncbi:MAG: hypothetical protein KY466_03315 [Gemmatimonadetes bacterium]|nr:hypothetical protein [Gemmatimonadota bacterium]